MQLLRPKTYVRVLQLPYANHLLAKETLNKAKESKSKIKIRKKAFDAKGKRTIRGLFYFNISQMPWYCPADNVEVKFSKDLVIIAYHSNQQFYKGMEEL